MSLCAVIARAKGPRQSIGRMADFQAGHTGLAFPHHFAYRSRPLTAGLIYEIIPEQCRHCDQFCIRGNLMTKKKISVKDFQADKSLSLHSQKSRAVARALDQRADQLPHAMVFTSFQFEEFLSQLTPKRF